MTLFDDTSWLTVSLQVCLLDLLLGGDNAIVIAMASRFCAADKVYQAITFGTAGAIIMRLLMATAAGYLLEVPYLRLVGAVVLLVIALNMFDQRGGAEAAGDDLARDANGGYLKAVLIIIVSDVMMSFDNVLALAAVTEGNSIYLAIGLVLSVPIIIYGSLFLVKLFDRYPVLVTGGAGFLAWIAGSLAVKDPAIADGIGTQSPLLAYAVPAVFSLFVMLRGSRSNGGRPASFSPVVARPAKAVLPLAPEAPIVPRHEPPARPIIAPRPTVPVKRPIDPDDGPDQPPPEGTKAEPPSRLVLFGLVFMFIVVSVVLLGVMYISAVKNIDAEPRDDYVATPKD